MEQSSMLNRALRASAVFWVTQCLEESGLKVRVESEGGLPAARLIVSGGVLQDLRIGIRAIARTNGIPCVLVHDRLELDSLDLLIFCLVLPEHRLFSAPTYRLDPRRPGAYRWIPRSASNLLVSIVTDAQWRAFRMSCGGMGALPGFPDREEESYSRSRSFT